MMEHDERRRRAEGMVCKGKPSGVGLDDCTSYSRVAWQGRSQNGVNLDRGQLFHLMSQHVGRLTRAGARPQADDPQV